MLEILLYALGVMYTPGPVNLIALNNGVQKYDVRALRFYAGVGAAMFILFYGCSLLSTQLIRPEWLFYFGLVGCSYIIYLAYKIAKARVKLDNNPSVDAPYLSFKDGLWVQLLNPKGVTAALPVATVQFPAQGIQGVTLGIWCVVLAILAFGAPLSYYVIGRLVGRKVNNPRYFRWFNIVMASLLVFVAVSLIYEMAQWHR